MDKLDKDQETESVEDQERTPRSLESREDSERTKPWTPQTCYPILILNPAIDFVGSEPVQLVNLII